MSKASSSHTWYRPFALAMFASMLSISGTLMTQFAVITWAWQTTGSTIASGLITVTSFSAVVGVSLFSGALVDRWNRKKAIIVTDIIGGITTGLILLLHQANQLQIWHLAILGLVLGTLEAFQFPAYMASITMMVEPEQRSRANGMFETAWNLAEIISAALGGILLALIGLDGVLLIDLASFAVIVLAISLIHIPQPESTGEVPGSLLLDVVAGFRYLLVRPSVLLTVLLFTSINVAYGTYQGVFRPMVLVFTHNSEQILGFALAAVSIGNLIGGIFATIWKGPKKRIPIILLSWSVMSSFGFVLAGLGRSLPLWLVGRFMAGVLNMIAVTLSSAIWQDNVDEHVQGRVFGIIRLISQGTVPISAFLATFLVQIVIGPAMQPGQGLANLVGGLFGTGDGASMSLAMVSTGLIFGVLLPLVGFLIPAIRNLDSQGSDGHQDAQSTGDMTHLEAGSFSHE
ncbi:MFS transporter [Ktedonosporobacter rubrisoli]|uniref:MFS transporter n=1 Tax=Ktedonosporobacter rubrisoli TaxID=2509675 RepID=A0A4P6JQ12_KTERU|nr:MFS transporter [Ktedonosporobacter rubrisoli]QBD77395.1 MFS transporter [Ktedonosporobacter rubrisoli]